MVSRDGASSRRAGGGGIKPQISCPTWLSPQSRAEPPAPPPAAWRRGFFAFRQRFGARGSLRDGRHNPAKLAAIDIAPLEISKRRRNRPPLRMTDPRKGLGWLLCAKLAADCEIPVWFEPASP